MVKRFETETISCYNGFLLFSMKSTSIVKDQEKAQ